MKTLVLLGLTTASLLSGVAAVTVVIRAYNVTGELDIRRDPSTLGTRVLLTCDVTGLPKGGEALSYRWYHNCPVRPNPRCEIQDGDPYYRVVSDTLLVDVTSWDQGGRFYCTVHDLQETQTATTRELSLAGSPAPFLYTPTSLLPQHSVLTDVQQATGKNGQQWIICRSGGQGTRPQIWMGSELVACSSTANMVVIGLGTDIQRLRGHYHCLSAQSQRKYFSLYLGNFGTLPTPTCHLSAQNTSMWTITSPDGSQVERYIVEFECSVRNMTFVERYTSVSASGGTGRVATSVSCFGGLGQLSRVRMWAVSGPNISPALVCTTDGQCTEEGGRGTPATTPEWSTDRSLPTHCGPPVSSTANLATGSTPPENTAISPSTSSGPHISSTGEQPIIDTIFIGVGVGVGVFLLLVVCISVVLILVVVVVKSKAATKQKRDTTEGDDPYNNNPAVVMQETEMTEQGAGNDYQNASNHTGEEEDPFCDGFSHYEVADRIIHSKNTKTPALKEPSTPASATNGPAVYATVDKSKKKGPKKEKNHVFSITHKEDQYAMPIKKEGKLTDIGEAVVGSGGVEEEEQYDDMVG